TCHHHGEVTLDERVLHHVGDARFVRDQLNALAGYELRWTHGRADGAAVAERVEDLGAANVATGRRAERGSGGPGSDRSLVHPAHPPGVWLIELERACHGVRDIVRAGTCTTSDPGAVHALVGRVEDFELVRDGNIGELAGR